MGDRYDGQHLGQPQPLPPSNVKLLFKPAAALKTDSFPMVVDCSCIGHELQQIIAKQHAIPVCRQMLLLNGRQIQHSDKLSDYSLEHGTEVCIDVHNTQEPSMTKKVKFDGVVHFDCHKKFELEDDTSEQVRTKVSADDPRWQACLAMIEGMLKERATAKIETSLNELVVKPVASFESQSHFDAMVASISEASRRISDQNALNAQSIAALRSQVGLGMDSPVVERRF